MLVHFVPGSTGVDSFGNIVLYNNCKKCPRRLTVVSFTSSFRCLTVDGQTYGKLYYQMLKRMENFTTKW
jgi:hypothetical protein